MQLIVILLATVSILTFLSGVIVFFGSKKGNKVQSAWFLLAAIFATIWMTSISIFLTANADSASTIDWHVKWTFVSAIIIDVAFLGYITWKTRYGKALTLFFTILGLIISVLIFCQPQMLYKDVILANTGNKVEMNIGPLYFAYNGFFALVVPAIIVALIQQYLKTKSNRKKGGDLIIMGSFGLSSGLTLAFNLIMPLFGNWILIWVGPLALAVTIIGFYYTILRYKSLNLSSIWLKLFSNIVIIASIAIIYMVIFSIIFAGLFRGSTPSIEVIILNFIMISVFLLLMPAINQLINYVKSLISGESSITKENEK